ncbi:MAG: VCBS repeat-containing protein, partial [Candidatus Aenigmatarchaeota archaeon]
VTLNANSGVTPSNISISIDTTGMAVGTYSGKVYLYANGTEHVVNIKLTIKEIPRLIVSPSSVVLHYLKGGTLPATVLNITTSSDSVSWSAQVDSAWLSLSALSGTTPASVTVSTDSSVSSYASGTYNGSITVTAPDAKGSPITIPVTLQVITGGSIAVKTNINEATFDISGPQNYSGSGTDWSVLDVTPGTYNITFGDVSGYKTPSPKTFTVTAGNNITIEAQYELVRVANTIIAGKGSDSENDATIRLMDLSGNILGEFKALTTGYGANVASADIDGDLSDEIIVGSGPSQSNQAVVAVLKPNGTLLATKTIANTAYGARIVTGDIDGDGVPEIAVSMITKVRNRNTNMIDIYSYSNGSLIRKAGAYASSAQGSSKAPLSIAMGDINGDGKAELVVFDSGYLKVFGFNTNLTTYLIASKAVTYANGTKQISIKDATATIGDINGDGKSEIVIGYVNDSGDSIIKAYKADLTETGMNFIAFAGGKVATSLSAMDTDGDGIVEILAGKGPASTNDATLRIFSSNGNMLKEIKAFDTLYGVNAALGFIKR